MSLKAYLYLAAAVALAYSYYWMYGHGKAVCRAEAAAAALAAKDRENAAITRALKKTDDLKIIYRDRVTIVKESTDACLDTALPPAVLDSLRRDAGSR